MKKKVAATRIIAAAETRIRVVEFDLAGGSGWDDGEVTLAAGADGSGAGTAAACGGVVRTKRTGAMPGGSLGRRTSLG